MSEKKEGKLSWKDAIMNKKMIFVFVQIVAAAILIVANVNGIIEIQVDETVSQEIEEAIAPEFEKLNNKMDEQTDTLSQIENRINDNDNKNIIMAIKKQGKKIEQENWGDIHDVDIDFAISGYADLVAKNYDPGELAKLEPDIILIRGYHAGKIGP